MGVLEPFSDEEVDELCLFPRGNMDMGVFINFMNGGLERLLNRLAKAEAVCGILQRGADNKLMDTDDIAHMDAALQAWNEAKG